MWTSESMAITILSITVGGFSYQVTHCWLFMDLTARSFQLFLTHLCNICDARIFARSVGLHTVLSFLCWKWLYGDTLIARCRLIIRIIRYCRRVVGLVVPDLRRNVVPSSSTNKLTASLSRFFRALFSWRWRRNDSSKRWEKLTQRQSVALQKKSSTVGTLDICKN
jgi:hypothetical protein